MTRLRHSHLTLAAGALVLAGSMASADQVFFDDLIVNGSACIGLDCANGESFGFDTLRLKENNLRIGFDDTSTSASFPSNDWEIEINDSTNGGSNYFRIDDRTSGRSPFTIEAGARNNALYVEADSDVGIGTANPAVTLHLVEGNTPTLRLEQDGSSGFTPQTWDVAGNEANFFVRDATNGSNLVFRIQPGAPGSSIYIANDGDIGLGTSNPAAELHVLQNSAVTQPIVHVEGLSSVANILVEDTDGRAQIWLEEPNSTSEMKIELANDLFDLSFNGTGGSELQIQRSTRNVRVVGGDLEVLVGNVVVGGMTLTVPDYVFAPDYELMPLNEVEAFINVNGHLPKIPSAEAINGGTLNMTQMQMALLEKVEELTLYTLDQEARIEALQLEIDALTAN